MYRRRVIRRPAAILALLTGINLLNYLDRWVLSAVLKPLEDELHLTKFVTGSLATVFLLGFFVTSPVFGILSDVFPRGRRALVALGVAIWSLATLSSGLAQTALALVAARALVGVGEASYTAIAPTIIDDVAPPAKRGSWLGIFFSAVPIGAALGFVVGGLVFTVTKSWRSAFFVAGWPGLLLAGLCLLIEDPQPAAAAERIDVLASARDLLPRAHYWRATLGQVAYTFGVGGFGFWAPLYIAERYGWDPGHASSVFGAITVCGGAAGTLLGGIVGDRVTRALANDEDAIIRANLLVCAIAMAVAAPLAVLAVLAPTASGFFAAMLPCEIALFFVNGPVNFALLRSVPAAMRASALAINIFTIHALGDLWSPPLIGRLAMSAPMQWAMMLVPGSFALAAVVWWEPHVPKEWKGPSKNPLAAG
jgi:MFS family permease